MRRDDIRRLAEQRKHVHNDMTKLIETAEGENRDLTAEEAEQYDKMAGEFTELETRQRRAETAWKQEQEVEKALGSSLELRVSGEEVPETLDEWKKQSAGPSPWDLPEVRRATFRYLTVKHPSELDVEEQRALSKASGAAGANLVPTSFYNQIINIARFMGPVNELASVMTTDSGETIQVPAITSHGVATWTAENAAYTASDEVFGQVSLGAFKAARSIQVSEELLTDSAFGLEGYLAQEFGESIGLLEETAYVNGNGTGKPTGITDAASAVTVTQAPTGNATTYTYSALLGLIWSLPQQYRRNSVFVVADSTVKNLYGMVDSQGRPLWAVNMAAQGPDTFLGYPVYSSPDLAAPAASSKDIIFGDIARAYRIRRVNGFSLQRQNELYSNNGQVGFRGFERVDGKVVLADALRIGQHSAT